jgi:hypothetical protein
MSYIKLDVEKIEETKKIFKNTLDKQIKTINIIKNNIKIQQTRPKKSRKLFAVDSGFNRAYETSFYIFKAAVVNEKVEVKRNEEIYFFHRDNFQTERLRRLFLQEIMYKTLLETIKNYRESLILVDGTITTKVFQPTKKDSEEYYEKFIDFFNNTYSPLLKKCLERDSILLGHLKRIESSYLAENLGLNEIHDSYIVNSILKDNGYYIAPIPLSKSKIEINTHNYKYLTFYLNLKNRNFRFELLEQNEEKFLECIENLLFWATESHQGMNPIFSKADENSRVTKREVNLKFNYIVHGLLEENRNLLRNKARNKTHFGYNS